MLYQRSQLQFFNSTLSIEITVTLVPFVSHCDLLYYVYKEKA